MKYQYWNETNILATTNTTPKPMPQEGDYIKIHKETYRVTHRIYDPQKNQWQIITTKI